MKNLPILIGKKREKPKDWGLEFLVITLNILYPVEEVERFDYCELSSGQVNRSFLVVLGDPVDLVCFQNRGNRSNRFDVYPKRGNNLCRLNAYSKKSDQPCAPQPFLFTGLIIDANKLIFFLASAISSWLTVLLFNNFNEFC